MTHGAIGGVSMLTEGVEAAQANPAGTFGNMNALSGLNGKEKCGDRWKGVQNNWSAASSDLRAFHENQNVQKPNQCSIVKISMDL
eukprot:1157396-Pelagomonas_calceolata.AAC.9